MHVPISRGNIPCCHGGFFIKKAIKTNCRLTRLVISSCLSSYIFAVIVIMY